MSWTMDYNTMFFDYVHYNTMFFDYVLETISSQIKANFIRSSFLL